MVRRDDHAVDALDEAAEQIRVVALDRFASELGVVGELEVHVAK